MTSTDFVPDWAKGIVWYQIFPERFWNGDPGNDPRLEDQAGSWPHDPNPPWQVHPWTSDWYELQPYERANGKSVWHNLQRRRYGGDLDVQRRQQDSPRTASCRGRAITFSRPPGAGWTRTATAIPPTASTAGGWTWPSVSAMPSGGPGAPQPVDPGPDPALDDLAGHCGSRGRQHRRGQRLRAQRNGHQLLISRRLTIWSRFTLHVSNHAQTRCF